VPDLDFGCDDHRVVGVGHSTRWGRRKRDGLFGEGKCGFDGVIDCRFNFMRSASVDELNQSTIARE